MSDIDVDIAELFEQPRAEAVTADLARSVLAAVERQGRRREQIVRVASLAGAGVTTLVAMAAAPSLAADLGEASMLLFAAGAASLAAATIAAGATLIEAA